MVFYLQEYWRQLQNPIHPTTAKLNTAYGSPMTALGMTALHLRIAEFKFTHNFIICNRLPDTEIIFGIDIQKKFSLSYAWDKEKIVIYKRMANFTLTHKTVNGRRQVAWSNQHFKILPRHNGVVPIKISGHMAYFFTDNNSTKGRDPNINIINSIHKIKKICQHISFQLYQ